jgi:hypothetical protein
MRDEILTYREMCDREGIQTLQRGMNFQHRPGYSVLLMSRRRNAPYRDSILEDGRTIEYEGHDAPRTPGRRDPKKLDQPRFLPSGKPTQNGLFAAAVDAFLKGQREPELVRVYEKIFAGVWSDKGFFRLVGYRMVVEGRRRVFRFLLEAIEEISASATPSEPQRSRLISSEIKKEVWKRDKGRCVLCGATDNLHFDHDLPWSKGGTSLLAENVRILCARHNLEKRDKIE